ncbi:DUF4916 domain-containing protein [Alloscardovia omnicolens]|uniref:DUF4916 domain-containing protein n=1 Tax=Alloscardovia omnicolens TaxID=419015 RepID=UPI003A66CE32
MPVLNDEVPDSDDFDAGRKRGEFDDITPDDFMRGSSSHNPPGWLARADIDEVRRKTPLPYVVVVPVRTDDLGRITYVGSLLTAHDADSTVSRTLITGRIVFHETIRESIARNISKDLGDITLAHIPPILQPFMVAEFFPTPGASPYFDSRQHAVALCYIVDIAGDCQPMDETLDVEWVTPQTALSPEFLAQLPNGFDRIVMQALTSAGL